MKQRPVSRAAGAKKGQSPEKIEEGWLIYRRDRSGEELCCLTLEGLSRSSRIPVPALERMIRRGLIESMPDDDRLFPPETVRRAVKVERLRLQLQIGLDGLEVILRLLDRMEAMEREMALLRRTGL
ncbi:MAG TPA: chaperone modulator CbpM [Candidatus Manganitrophaceae bacterium]|nr:chaperone modulator CbpM [Candidatus Manganitrophaceae bacterium]